MIFWQKKCMFLLIFWKIIFKSACTFGSFNLHGLFLGKVFILTVSDFVISCHENPIKKLCAFYHCLSIFSCEHINFWIPHLGIVYLSVLYLWAFLLVDLLHGQCLPEHSVLVSIFTCGSFAWAVFACILYLSIFTCGSSACAEFT